MILNVFVTKMSVNVCLLQRVVVVMLLLFFSVTNLKYWTRSKLIVGKTLQLLNDLSIGYV